MTPLIESSPFLIILTALMTGLILALLVMTGWRIWRSSRLRKKQRQYLALRVAVSLEDYARQCMEAIHDVELHTATNGEIGQPGLGMPALAEYPSDAPWDLFDSEVANRILSFRNTVRSASLRVQSSLLDNRTMVTGFFFEECGICGADAFELARSLRARHGLNPFRPSYDYPGMLAHRAVTARAKNDSGENGQVIKLDTAPFVARADDELPAIPIKRASA